MSAVPKKKLCWNCEGNVSRDIESCPYCGVYVQPPEFRESSNWNPNYSSSKTEDISSPLYQINTDIGIEENASDIQSEIELDQSPAPSNHLFQKIKQDLFPVIFLMMGSSFFLFGTMLLLFSQNGTFTLQWEGSYGFYFLLAALPFTFFGWKYLQQIEE